MALLDLLIIDDRPAEGSAALMAVVRALGLEELYRACFDEDWFPELLGIKLLGGPTKGVARGCSIVICDDHFSHENGVSANALGFFFTLTGQFGARPAHALWIRKSAMLMAGENAGAYEALGVHNADGQGWQASIERLVREWIRLEDSAPEQRVWRTARAAGTPVSALRIRPGEPDGPLQDLAHQVYFDIPPGERRCMELAVSRPIRRVVNDVTLPSRSSSRLDTVAVVGLDLTAPWDGIVERFCKTRGGAIVDASVTHPGILVWRSTAPFASHLSNMTPAVIVILSPALPQGLEATWLKRRAEAVVWSRRTTTQDCAKFTAVFLAALALTHDLTVSAHVAAAASGASGEYRVFSRSDSEWGLSAADPSRPVYVDLHEEQIDVAAQATDTASHATLQRTINRLFPFVDPAEFRANLARVERQIGQVLCDGVAVGTGFLVGPDILLTAHHVAYGATGRMSVRFDYAPNMQPREFVADTSRILASRPAAPIVEEASAEGPLDESHLDYAFLKLEGRPAADKLGEAERGFLDLSRLPYAFTPHDTILILGHPLRRPLQLSFAAPSDAHLTPRGNRVRYQTNTEAGSSGSPVFNGEWRLVALHHSSGSLDSRPFNQGIPLCRIALDVRRQSLALIDVLCAELQATVEKSPEARPNVALGSCVRIAGAAGIFWRREASALRAALRAAGSAIGLTSNTSPGVFSGDVTAEAAVVQLTDVKNAWSE